MVEKLQALQVALTWAWLILTAALTLTTLYAVVWMIAHGKLNGL